MRSFLSCSMDLKIEQEDNGNKGRFYIRAEGKQLAEMTYVYAGPEKIIIDHTEVGEELKGKGAGKQLVDASANFAREKGIKILPLCPFAKATMMKNRETYADVLA